MAGSSTRNESAGNDSAGNNPSARAPGLLGLTARIVSAHVSSHAIATSEIPKLIKDVFQALHGSPLPPERTSRFAPAEGQKPAVPVGKSVFDDHLVCLQCAQQQKTLKRHLQSAHGMTPEQYRARWELDPDYPMVAPAYARRRSALAKAIGLGTRPRAPRG